MVYASVATGLAAAFSWGTADYMSRSQSQRIGYYRTVVYSHFVTLVVLIGLIPVIAPTIQFPVLPVLVLAGAGAVNFAAFIFLYRAYHIGIVSVVAPVAYTYPAVTTVLSVAILGSFLTSLQLLAILGILAGVILVSTRFSQLYGFLRGTGAPNLTRGVSSAMGASVLFGTVYIAIGYTAPLVSVVLPVLVLRAVAIVAGLVLAPLFHQTLRPSRQAFSTRIVAMGVLEALGFLVFTYGISTAGGSLPIVVALSSMGGAVAASYGLAFLKERLEPNQIAGVILSLLGVFTLLYFGG